MAFKSSAPVVARENSNKWDVVPFSEEPLAFMRVSVGFKDLKRSSSNFTYSLDYGMN